MVNYILAAVAMIAVAAAAYADESRAGLPSSPPGVWTLEIGAEVTREAWNYNVSDEDLWGGSANVWYRINRSWSIGAEALVVWVHQERVRSTPVAGFALVGRREFVTRKLAYFVESVGGLSYAARFVPQRGTRFNYVAAVGAGIIRPVGRDTHLVVSGRWLHLSNSGMAGRDRNPDIQALGIGVAVLMPLRRR